MCKFHCSNLHPCLARVPLQTDNLKYTFISFWSRLNSLKYIVIKAEWNQVGKRKMEWNGTKKEKYEKRRKKKFRQLFLSWPQICTSVFVHYRNLWLGIIFVPFVSLSFILVAPTATDIYTDTHLPIQFHWNALRKKGTFIQCGTCSQFSIGISGW